MKQVRRRLWSPERGRRKEGIRLSTMVVLLAVVLLLMAAANQPQIWSQFFPNLQKPAPAQSADGAAGNPDPSAKPVASHAADSRSPLMWGGLIVLALAYFSWRITRIGRSFLRSAHAKRRGPARASTPPES
jgi:hypothetical protein